MRQETCAIQAGISAPYLANIEAGRKHPSLMVASRLAHALGVPLEAITYPMSVGSAGDPAPPDRATTGGRTNAVVQVRPHDHRVSVTPQHTGGTA